MQLHEGSIMLYLSRQVGFAVGFEEFKKISTSSLTIVTHCEYDA